MSNTITQLAEFNSSVISKVQACDYLEISRSTFDKMVTEGKIPKERNELDLKNHLGLKNQLNHLN